MKECFKCKQVKPLDEFYRHPRMTDGHLGKCKDCARSDGRGYRAANLEYYKEYDRARQQTTIRRKAKKRYGEKWRAKNQDKKAAQQILANAIRSKRICKQPCSVCGTTENIHAHHQDYAKPLEVIWLCCQHHHDVHNGKVELP